jgi:hypothetical protein
MGENGSTEQLPGRLHDFGAPLAVKAEAAEMKSRGDRR